MIDMGLIRDAAAYELAGQKRHAKKLANKARRQASPHERCQVRELIRQERSALAAVAVS